jgi:hypothetical protein
MKNLKPLILSIFLICMIAGSACAISYNPHEGNTYWVGADGNRIILTNNDNAKNPSYANLIAFIKLDKTDRIKYRLGSFTCGDFAERLHNNAERAGYKCGWVTMKFTDGKAHACNVFDTKDKGHVYIDCTGSSSGNTDRDTIVKLAVGNKYTPIPPFLKNYYYFPMGTVKNYKIFW